VIEQMVRWVLLGLGALAIVAGPARARDEVIDSPMYGDPPLPGPTIEWVFPEKAKALWLKALEGPQADVRCKAAAAIALAQRRGFKGLDTTIPHLREALDRADQHPPVRLAVARTLVALDAHDAAPNLFEQAKSGDGDLREIVEPALARWDYRPARDVWLARLRDPDAPPRTLVLAIRGLAAVREKQAADRLRELALSDRTAGPVRLEAARALGTLRSEGLEQDAESLMGGPSPHGLVGRLAAAALLRQHRGKQAVDLLGQLADAEPAVAALAVARLIEIDCKLVVPTVERLLASPDASVRSLAVEVLFREPTEKHVRLLGDALNDAHPDVRTKARRSLRELGGRKELREAVLAQGMRVLKGRDWHGQEQAAILLAQLDHKPAAGRLVDLLPVEENRPEVYVTAAWALRRLAVADALPGVVKYVKRQQPRLRAAPGPTPTAIVWDHQLSQLNQLLGEQKHGPADEALREFLPRMEKPMSAPFGGESRAAAIWALGRIHEGKADPKLAAALEERLNDTGQEPAEDVRVRRMAAVSLGRMKADGALPSLRKHLFGREATEDPVNNACGWAVMQLTGGKEPTLPPKTVRKVQLDWFLIPYEGEKK
jgi:HEAT repeat protein